MRPARSLRTCCGNAAADHRRAELGRHAISGEQEYAVGGLGARPYSLRRLPARSVKRLSSCRSVAVDLGSLVWDCAAMLSVTRATSVRPTLRSHCSENADAVAGICARLAGCAGHRARRGARRSLRPRRPPSSPAPVTSSTCPPAARATCRSDSALAPRRDLWERRPATSRAGDSWSGSRRPPRLSARGCGGGRRTGRGAGPGRARRPGRRRPEPVAGRSTLR